MVEVGEPLAVAASGAAVPADARACPRCGDFAPLVTRLGRAQCEACWQRHAELGVSVGGVLDDVKRLAGRLLLPAWLAVFVLDLPEVAGGALYTLKTGKDLPFSASSFYYFVTLLAIGAVTHASHQMLMGDPRIEWRRAFAASMQRWGGIAVAAWAANVVSALFMLLLIVPGVLRFLSYFITTPVALHERTDMNATLKRSAELTHGHRWVILGALCSVVVLGMVPMLVVVALIGLALGLASVADPLLGVIIGASSEVMVQVPIVLVTFATASLYVRCSLSKSRTA